jgi:predicted NAD/FAD-binding protein
MKNRKENIAIIGTGIAGLGCAHFLNSIYNLTLFEQESYAGGHSNTIEVQEDSQRVPVDTGFIVYNEVTYPNLTRLFSELGVRSQLSTMSFSVQHIPSGLEYSGSSPNSLFAQRKNLMNLRFLRMLQQIHRFNREAKQVLDHGPIVGLTLKDYVDQGGYGDDFLNLYLIPMSSAVWSSPPLQMHTFPAQTLLRFFHNHGFLGMHTQHPWRTVVGGSQAYVARLTEPFQDRILLRQPVQQVRREDSSVKLILASGAALHFDKVIFACHADQALRLLEAPSPEEIGLLGKFLYQPNIATLHTDEKVMPRARRAWASWNYRIDRLSETISDNDTTETKLHPPSAEFIGIGHRPELPSRKWNSSLEEGVHPSTVYWMNSLQKMTTGKNYFVSINDPGRIDPQKILRTIHYEHPLFDSAAIQAQPDLPKLNQHSTDQKAYFCGSYFKYGFHEDALTSALDLCRHLLSKPLWKAA